MRVFDDVYEASVGWGEICELDDVFPGFFWDKGWDVFGVDFNFFEGASQEKVPFFGVDHFFWVFCGDLNFCRDGECVEKFILLEKTAANIFEEAFGYVFD